MVLLTPFSFLEDAGIKNAAMLNNLVIAGIAFKVMAKMDLLPSIAKVGGAMKTAMLPLLAFSVTFGVIMAL